MRFKDMIMQDEFSPLMLKEMYGDNKGELLF